MRAYFAFFYFGSLLVCLFCLFVYINIVYGYVNHVHVWLFMISVQNNEHILYHVGLYFPKQSHNLRLIPFEMVYMHDEL